jgi:O-antigen/teichoic acid export membrane protein
LRDSSYHRILKATSIFGGVQIFTILISIFRSKIIAIFLGPTGIGISNLFTSTIDLVSSITSFGIGTSAVRSIAAANGIKDDTRLSVIIGVLRKIIWLTGVLGLIITIIFSQYLSLFAFGDTNYTMAFIFLSFTLLFNQLNHGQLALLQGMQKINLMAKAGLISSFFGFLISIPLYYYFNENGIVPGIIISSLLTLFFSYFYSNKIEIKKILITKYHIFSEGKTLLTLGFLIGLTGLMDQLISYFTRIYISNQSDINTIGLYTAGFAIMNTYVGMIFSAMLSDYYPKLSSVSNNNVSSNKLINQQAEISVIILGPLIIAFIVFLKYIILFLYTNQFLLIENMLYWAILGVLFKGVNWALGIILLAKGESRLYFIFYVISCVIILSTNLFFFNNFGLTGLGIAFLITNILLLLQSFIIASYRYSFKFTKELLNVFFIHLLLCCLVFLSIKYSPQPYNYLISALILFISILASYKQLNNRIDITEIVLSIKNKILNKP